MKKTFTLLAMAFAAMSMNAQTILAWNDDLDKANTITFDNGYTIAITGKTGKQLSKGTEITVDGTTYQTLKLSNGAQNTVTAPEGKTFNKVTFYSYMNLKVDAEEVRPAYWREVNGVEYNEESSGGIMKSCNQDFGGSIPGSEGLVGPDQPDKREYNLTEPVSSMTFTNKGEQLGFIMILETVTTGISTISNDAIELNGPIYNLSGQRVDKSYKGVVIRNGKKFIQ